MASEYTYDEEGETWPFFVLALLTFVLIPVSISWIYNIYVDDDPQAINKDIPGSFSVGPVANSESKCKYQRKKRSSKFLNKRFVFLVLGWSLVAYVATTFVQEANLVGTFDPYAILDVSVMTSEADIKKKYKRLSLKFHPDKLPRDLTDEQREAKEQEFVIMNQAYKALTDPVTRENFLRYGHPDGPQEVKHGIAIPQFLVEGKYSPLMVLVYFLLIGGVLPAIVGSWWNNVKTHTKKGLHVDTAAHFARKLADRNPSIVVTPFVILDWILQSRELQGFSNCKQIVSQYLNRDFSAPNTEQIIAQLVPLISGLIDIALVFRQTEVVLAATDLKKCIVACVPPTGKYQALQQLPGVNFDSIKAQDVKTLGKLLTLNEKQQSSILGLNGTQLKDAIQFASHVPSLRIIDAKFEVPGEDIVPPMANSHLVLKFAVKGPLHKGFPEIDPKDSRLQSPTSIEYMKDPTITNSQQPLLPYATTPYFPEYMRLAWTVIVIDQKDNKIAEGFPNIEVARFDLSNLKLTAQEFLKSENLIISSYRLPYQQPTPASAGVYNYRVILKCNSYFGCDVDIPVDMEVEVPTTKLFNNIKEKKMLLGQEDDSSDDEEDEEDSDSDISDPEEDSLAGTLAALRGGQVKSSKIESVETDDDNDSVFTDINTDTEDEAEN